MLELDFSEYLPDLFVTLLIEGIEVLPNSALKKEWLLWDECNTLSEHVQSNVTDVNPINLDCTFAQLTQSEQNLQDRALSSTSATDNTNFHAWLDNEREVKD